MTHSTESKTGAVCLLLPPPPPPGAEGTEWKSGLWHKPGFSIQGLE
jgi:hypothetical protein